MLWADASFEYAARLSSPRTVTRSYYATFSLAVVPVPLGARAIREVRMEQQVEGHPEREGVGEQEEGESNCEGNAGDLHLQNAETRCYEEPNNSENANDGGETEVDDVGAEKIPILVGEEGVAMRAAVLQGEPAFENLAAAAVWAVSKQAAAKGLEEFPEPVVAEVDGSRVERGFGCHSFCPDRKECVSSFADVRSVKSDTFPEGTPIEMGGLVCMIASLMLSGYEA